MYDRQAPSWWHLRRSVSSSPRRLAAMRRIGAPGVHEFRRALDNVMRFLNSMCRMSPSSVRNRSRRLFGVTVTEIKFVAIVIVACARWQWGRCMRSKVLGELTCKRSRNSVEMNQPAGPVCGGVPERAWASVFSCRLGLWPSTIRRAAKNALHWSNLWFCRERTAWLASILWPFYPSRSA